MEIIHTQKINNQYKNVDNSKMATKYILARVYVTNKMNSFRMKIFKKKTSKAPIYVIRNANHEP